LEDKKLDNLVHTIFSSNLSKMPTMPEENRGPWSKKFENRWSKVHGTKRPGFDGKNLDGKDIVVQTGTGEII